MEPIHEKAERNHVPRWNNDRREKRNDLLAEHNNVLCEHNVGLAESDHVVAGHNSVLAECTNALREWNVALSESDDMLAEHVVALGEHPAAFTELAIAPDGVAFAYGPHPVVVDGRMHAVRNPPDPDQHHSCVNQLLPPAVAWMPYGSAESVLCSIVRTDAMKFFARVA